jgi:uncharacterized protein YcbK (DUF882 family)
MISLQELNPHGYPTNTEINQNLSTLLDRINQVRTAYGLPMMVTSGLRLEADQQRINPKGPKSHHLVGEAVDIADPDGALHSWCKANEALLVSIGLWMEAGTVGWVHFQIVPPRSGNRWFLA